MRALCGSLAVVVAAVLVVGCGESPDISREQQPAERVAAPALAETEVDVLPRRESGPDIVYPDSLRQAGVEGRVVVAGVVDVDGTVDPGSVAVVTSTHAGFEVAAIEWLASATFSPGTVGGKPVRVRIEVPIEFRLAG